MFGMGFFEILMIAVVAIIFLGPEKLPKALVDMAKFFKAVKKTMDDAKESLEREVNLSKIKEEALAYKNSLTQDVQTLSKNLELKELNLDLDEHLSPSTPPIPTSQETNPKKSQDSLQEKQDSTLTQSTQQKTFNPAKEIKLNQSSKTTLNFGENLEQETNGIQKLGNKE